MQTFTSNFLLLRFFPLSLEYSCRNRGRAIEVSFTFSESERALIRSSTFYEEVAIKSILLD